MGDLDAIKRRQQEVWATGDFAKIAVSQILVGELPCEAVDLHPLQTVLDVATGSGNTALAAARRYAEVTAIDSVPCLLKRGRERAAAEGLGVTFREGDAENLPFPDASLDAVLSTFGAMLAPNQERAAGELLRVCRSGAGQRTSFPSAMSSHPWIARLRRSWTIFWATSGQPPTL